MDVKKHLEKYLPNLGKNTTPNELKAASAQFNNAVGGPRFRNQTGNNNRGWQGQGGMSNAAGLPNYANGGMSAPSRPYILNIKNATDVDVVVPLFGFNTHYTAFTSAEGVSFTFNAAGNLVGGGVTVSNAVGNNTTYQGLLSQSNTQFFNVGMTHIKVNAGDYQTQLSESMSYVNVDQGSGNVMQGPLHFIVGDGQFQNAQATNTDSYPMNGNTTINYKIVAGVTLKLYIFSDTIVDVSAYLGGAKPVQNFAKPQFNNPGN
jgi:hypothetical protein